MRANPYGNSYQRGWNVWQGAPPKGEPQPGQPRGQSRPQTVRNYGAGGADLTPVGENMFKGVASGAKRLAGEAARVEAINLAVTGTPEFGPGRSTWGGKDRRSSSSFDDVVTRARGGGTGLPPGPQLSRTRQRARSSFDKVMSTRSKPSQRMLARGPIVVEPPKALPPVGNNFETKATRSLGPGPSPEFDKVSPVSSELAEAARLEAMGGSKTVNPNKGPMPWATEGSRAQPAVKRKAGGKPGMLDRALRQ